MEECIVCKDEYNLNDKKPFRLFCSNHTLCKVCLEHLYITSGEIITCPMCNILSYEDISSYKEDEFLIKKLIKSFVGCSIHPDRSSSYINTTSYKTICNECFITSANKTNYSKELSRSIKTRLFQVFLRQKSNLSFEFKNYVIYSLKSTISDQYLLLHLITLYISKSPNCSTHPSEQFTVISIQDFTLCCNLCRKEGIDIAYNRIYYDLCNYIGQILYSPEPPGSVLKNFYHFSPFFISPIIEAYLFKNKKFQSCKQRSCMKCGKSFKLGARMPYTLSCGHYMCRICVNSKSICTIHQIKTDKATPFFDLDLYTMPTCKNCGSSEMNCDNLPLHFFCNCIICSRCSQTLKYCLDCLDLIDLPKEGRLKVHKRALNTLNYLKNDLICARCRLYNAITFLSENYIPVCGGCSNYQEPKVDILMTMAFDKFIYDFFGEWVESEGHPNFVTYPICKKIREVSIIAGMQPNSAIINNTQECKEVKRFETIYPIHKNDMRSFKPAARASIFLDILISVPVLLLGLVLGGSIDGTNTTQRITIYNARNIEIYNQMVDTRGKFNYVFFQNIPRANYFKVKVEYLQAGAFYCGKVLTENNLSVLVDGVEFRFYDASKLSGEVRGPILAVLYSN